MAVSYLSIVNSVMARMRESTVASVDETSYAKMIGEFVKQATSEVEDAWDWHILRTTIQIVTQEGSYDYVLSGAGVSFHVLQVLEDQNDYELRRAPSYQQMNRWLLSNNQSYDAPQYWDWNGRAESGGDPIVNVYPIPDQPYSLNFNLKVKTSPQQDTDVITVPQLPIILRATQLAIEERGDDGGNSASTVASQASSALADAISYDALLYEAEQNWETV